MNARVQGSIFANTPSIFASSPGIFASATETSGAKAAAIRTPNTEGGSTAAASGGSSRGLTGAASSEPSLLGGAGMPAMSAAEREAVQACESAAQAIQGGQPGEKDGELEMGEAEGGSRGRDGRSSREQEERGGKGEAERDGQAGDAPSADASATSSVSKLIGGRPEGARTKLQASRRPAADQPVGAREGDGGEDGRKSVGNVRERQIGGMDGERDRVDRAKGEGDWHPSAGRRHDVGGRSDGSDQVGDEHGLRQEDVGRQDDGAVRGHAVPIGVEEGRREERPELAGKLDGGIAGVENTEGRKGKGEPLIRRPQGKVKLRLRGGGEREQEKRGSDRGKNHARGEETRDQKGRAGEAQERGTAARGHEGEESEALAQEVAESVLRERKESETRTREMAENAQQKQRGSETLEQSAADVAMQRRENEREAMQRGHAALKRDVNSLGAAMNVTGWGKLPIEKRKYEYTAGGTD